MCLPCGLVAQNRATKAMLAEIEGRWQLDNNGNVTMSKVIEMPGISKDELYNRALSYFTYNYRQGDAVIQIDDKGQGLIIGKGLYPNVYSGLLSVFSTYHIVRVDVKEERVRVLVTMTAYRVEDVGVVSELLFGTIVLNTCDWPVSSRFPIVKADEDKNAMAKLFYNSIQCAMNTMDMIEKSLKEGNTGSDLDNW